MRGKKKGEKHRRKGWVKPLKVHPNNPRLKVK